MQWNNILKGSMYISETTRISFCRAANSNALAVRHTHLIDFNVKCQPGWSKT